MITYLGMTAPIALFSMITWLKNPYEGNKSEVEVKHLKLKDIIPMIILTVIVTFVFYFILDYFNTANLIPSTFSVTTSFLAIYLTTKRSPFLCSCICRKRPCAYRTLEHCRKNKYYICFCGRLLCSIFVK